MGPILKSRSQLQSKGEGDICTCSLFTKYMAIFRHIQKDPSEPSVLRESQEGVSHIKHKSFHNQSAHFLDALEHKEIIMEKTLPGASLGLDPILMPQEGSWTHLVFSKHRFPGSRDSSKPRPCSVFIPFFLF